MASKFGDGHVRWITDFSDLQSSHPGISFEVHRIALIFLQISKILQISWIFNCLPKYFSMKIFDTWRSFHALTARASMDNILGMATESTRNSLQGDTFEVDIALLTAASLMRQQCDGNSACQIKRPGLYAMPIAHYMCGMCMQRICDIISLKIAIHENLRPSKIFCYTVYCKDWNKSRKLVWSLEPNALHYWMK